jgi:hypothetical protein
MESKDEREPSARRVSSAIPPGFVPNGGGIRAFLTVFPCGKAFGEVAKAFLELGKGFPAPGKGVFEHGKGIFVRGKGLSAPGKGFLEHGKGVLARGKGFPAVGKGVRRRGKGVSDPGKGLLARENERLPGCKLSPSSVSHFPSCNSAARLAVFPPT